MISDFRNKKVVEYLRELPSGSKVLIRFGHGWGDTQMFIPSFEYLKSLFPELIIDLYVECGQEKIFESYHTKDSTEHDLVFSLNFPMSEGSNLTKAAKCCVEELGIEPVERFAELPEYGSPFVACHFHGTALPNSVNCPEDVARKIWNEIIEAGKIPIECHFEHVFHNPINGKFDFVNNTARGCKANLHNLIGLIQHSHAFIGVASGPFVTAVCTIPNETLYLERSHKLENYTKLNISKVNVLDYKEGSVKQWLGSL